VVERYAAQRAEASSNTVLTRLASLLDKSFTALLGGASG
jgi:hypothetical protein